MKRKIIFILGCIGILNFATVLTHASEVPDTQLETDASEVLNNQDEMDSKELEKSLMNGIESLPDDPEYETLIESDYADVRNTSKDGCGAITAGLFLKKFVDGRAWLHLDIAGTADNSGIVWQHQVPGATGTAVSTLYHLAQILFETNEEEQA